MKLLNILSEIGEADIPPYPYRLKFIKEVDWGQQVLDPDLPDRIFLVRDWFGFFTTDSSDDYRVHFRFEDKDKTDGREKSLEITFEVQAGGTYLPNLTGRGLSELVKVMSTVVAMTKDVVDKEESMTGVPLSFFTFAGESSGKIPGERNMKYKKQRENLYLYYVNKVIKPKEIIKKDFAVYVYL